MMKQKMRKILLTGCTTGIGNAILQELLEDKHNVIYAVSKNAHKLEKLKSDNCKLYECDFNDTNNTINIIKQIKKETDGIDILINNAGIGIFKKIEEFNLEDWEKIIKINLTTPYLFINSFITEMKLNNYGKIISISSDADYAGFMDGSAYCASKFGLRGLTESVRKEIVGYNISLTTISPGRVDTYFNRKKPGDRPISLKAQDVAKQVINVIEQRENVCIDKIYLSSSLE